MIRSTSRGSGHGRAMLQVAALAVAGFTLSAGSLGAQELKDSRWMPWLGCWQAEGPLVSEGPLVCVRPSGSGVEIAGVADGEIATSRLLIADGQSQPVSQEGCTGWQTAAFSADSRRVFLRSEMTCEGGAKRTASALMSMTTPSVWLDAQSVGMDGESMPRALRFRPAPTELGRATGFAVPVERMTAVMEARLLASADLSLDDVLEASSRIDAVALQAFVAEHGQPFDMDANALIELADAGVDTDVIDMLVAVSYPQRFAIDREASNADMVEPEYERDPRYVDRYGYDPFGWGNYRYNSYGSNSCYGLFYDSFYCNDYRYGYGYGSGYGFGSGYGYGYSGRPVIVVIGDDEPGNSGKVVSGRGWTRGGSSSGGSSAQGSSSGRQQPASTVTGGSSRGATSGGYTRPASTGSSSSGSKGTARKKGGGGL